MENSSKNSLKVEGNIGDIKIKGTLLLETTATNSNINNYKIRPINWSVIIIKLTIPLITLGLLFLGGAILCKSLYYWLVVISPLIFGWLFYNFVFYSTPENYNYLKKLTDVITLISSFIAASLIILKIFSMNSSIVDYLIYVNEEDLVSTTEKIIFLAQSLLLFLSLEIFSAFATIKLLFAVKDFNDARKSLK